VKHYGSVLRTPLALCQIPRCQMRFDVALLLRKGRLHRLNEQKQAKIDIFICFLANQFIGHAQHHLYGIVLTAQ